MNDILERSINMDKIIYRPGGLLYSFYESIKEMKKFKSTEKMIDYIAKRFKNGEKETRMFDINLSYDVVIENESFDDDRIGWKDVHRICIKSVYDITPKCIGYCAFGWSTK
jgi:hypothetical protein